jgi:hypothetical protein
VESRFIRIYALPHQHPRQIYWPSSATAPDAAPAYSSTTMAE